MKLRILLTLATLLFSTFAFGAIDDETVLIDDMLIERSALEDPTIADSPSTRGAAKLKVQLWEDGILPIHFPKSFSKEDKEFFMSACREWEKVANVKCIEGRYKGRKLSVTAYKLGCFSLYGMGTNFLVLRRRMNLARPGCWNKPTIIHELGHAFGLIHEHQRPDRDQYVTIHRENAQKGFLGLNFVVNFKELGSKPLSSYDFRSIMHYRRKAFSKNGKDTIVPQPEFMEYIEIIGNGKTVSAGDAQTMSALYGPPRQ